MIFYLFLSFIFFSSLHVIITVDGETMAEAAIREDVDPPCHSACDCKVYIYEDCSANAYNSCYIFPNPGTNGTCRSSGSCNVGKDEGRTSRECFPNEICAVDSCGSPKNPGAPGDPKKCPKTEIPSQCEGNDPLHLKLKGGTPSSTGNTGISGSASGPDTPAGSGPSVNANADTSGNVGGGASTGSKKKKKKAKKAKKKEE